jgi:hypothetical protein
MHVMLTGPQWCLLHGIEANDPGWNFFWEYFSTLF